MNLQKLAQRILADGGATYSLQYGEPVSGAFASIAGFEKRITLRNDFIRLKRQIALSIIDDELKAYIAEHSELLADDANYLGAWVDGGDLVLDVSKRFNSIADAEAFGRENGQKAIYDFHAGVIYL